MFNTSFLAEHLLNLHVTVLAYIVEQQLEHHQAKILEVQKFLFTDNFIGFEYFKTFGAFPQILDVVFFREPFLRNVMLEYESLIIPNVIAGHYQSITYFIITAGAQFFT
jgi:hypothetical protein